MNPIQVSERIRFLPIGGDRATRSAPRARSLRLALKHRKLFPVCSAEIPETISTNTGNYRHRTPEKKVISTLSTDNNFKRELRRGCEQQQSPSLPASNDEGSGDPEKAVATLADQSEAITRRARRAGAPQFVFEGSEPWRAWNAYRHAHGIPGPLPTRQCMIDGRWRTGWDRRRFTHPVIARLRKAVPRD